MTFTPAHVARARGPRSRQLSPQELIRIRELYLEKRYKQCIAACEELLEPLPSTPVTPTFSLTACTELHAVHRAFLIFHQAISYESMGLAAHKYSQNKLRFLEAAKEKFDAVLNILPQPFANGEDGKCQTPHFDSPDLQQQDDDASHYGDGSPSLSTDSISDGEDPDDADDFSSLDPIIVSKRSHPHEGQEETRIASETPSMQVSHRTRSPSEESLGSNTTGTTVSQAYTVPDFSKYSPRQHMLGQDANPSPPETPKPLKSGGMLPRSVPLVKIDPADFDSSDDENESGHEQSGWLPRSMRSLNLAAHNISSDDDSDDEEATPSKQSAGVTRTKNAELAVPLLTGQTPATPAMANLRSPPISSQSYTFRLSASLSSKHMLCKDLVPSPLFSKTKKIAMVTLETEDSKPAPRPLPRTPHSFHSHINLLPARKTAVQTLISKFEGVLPSPGTPSSYTTATAPASSSSRMTLRTPATLRFDMIRDAFDSSPDQMHLKAYLTSRSLAHYNSQLAAFRTCLVIASERTADQLAAAQALQEQHEEDKRGSELRDTADGLPRNRLASMWLLSTPGKPPALKSRNGRHHPEQIASPTPRAKMLARSESLRSRKKLPLRNRVEESEEKRAERIKKLRECGFRVNKERYGWKGDDYYEGFRRSVEIELGA